ncbi:hypothetical protein Tco_0598651 [Tanacetum coccineum]
MQANINETASLPPQPQQGSRINKLETMDLPKMIREQTVEFIDSQEIDRKINESVKEVVISSVKHAMRAPLRARFKDLPTSDMRNVCSKVLLEENYDQGTCCPPCSICSTAGLYPCDDNSLKTPPGSPPLPPPPPPPPSGASGASGTTRASDSAQAPPSPPPSSSTHQGDQFKPSIIMILMIFMMDDETTLDEQASSSGERCLTVMDEEDVKETPSSRDSFAFLSVCRFNVFSMYGYNYMKKIVLRRADLKEYVIAERETFFQLLVTIVDFDDLAVISHQNRWDATGFEFKPGIHSLDSPRAVTLRDRYGVQMMMRFNEIHKFSDGTLQQIDEALDYRVKEFRVNRINPGMNTRFWTKKDVVRSKEFHVRFQITLRHDVSSRNLEILLKMNLPDHRSVPWVDEKPWTNTGVWTKPTPVKHTCKPFNYKIGYSECPTCSWKDDGYSNGGNLPETYIIGNRLHYQDYEWYEALEGSELKDEALRNKAIMERFINEGDDESRYEQERRWNIYTKYDDAYEINHEDNEREELCEVHELPVCNIRRYMMIKYSFNNDEEYVAVKEDNTMIL